MVLCPVRFGCGNIQHPRRTYTGDSTKMMGKSLEIQSRACRVSVKAVNRTGTACGREVGS